jgi:hypothetical protein
MQENVLNARELLNDFDHQISSRIHRDRTGLQLCLPKSTQRSQPSTKAQENMAMNLKQLHAMIVADIRVLRPCNDSVS